MINLPKEHFIYSDGSHNFILAKNTKRKGVKKVVNLTYHKDMFSSWLSAKNILGDQVFDLPEHKKLKSLYRLMKNLPEYNDEVLYKYEKEVSGKNVEQSISIIEDKGDFCVSHWDGARQVFKYYFQDKQLAFKKALWCIALKVGENGSLTKVVKTIKESIVNTIK